MTLLLMFSVCVALVMTMLIMFAAFTMKYYQLKADTSSAQSFTLLKNFFAYVDDLEYNVFNRDVEKTDFKETVEKITGLKISDKESEYLLKMVDVNRNGIGEDSALGRAMATTTLTRVDASFCFVSHSE